MFCSNCGAECANGDKFCTSCGVVLENYVGQEAFVQNESKKTRVGKSKIFGAVGALLALILILFVFKNTNRTINLNKYIEISATGYDTVGRAEVSFDWESFDEDLSDKIKLKRNSELQSYTLLIGRTIERQFYDSCVEFDLDNTSNLSNGDVVSLSWNCDDILAKEVYGVKLKYSDITYTVKDLTEVEKFDPFEHITVSFDGVTPNARVSIQTDDNCEQMDDVIIDCDKWYDIKEGESITVYAYIDESFIDKYGAALGKTEETYVANGLAHYVSKINEIPEDVYNAMDKQLQDAMVASFASKRCNLEDMQLVGNYLLSLKDGFDATDHNRLVFVYKITTSNKYSNGSFDYYWYGSYTNLVVSADGTCEGNINSYIVPSSWDGSFYRGDIWIEYIGFEDREKLFDSVVASMMEYYTYSTNINTQ